MAWYVVWPLNKKVQEFHMSCIFTHNRNIIDISSWRHIVNVLFSAHQTFNHTAYLLNAENMHYPYHLLSQNGWVGFQVKTKEISWFLLLKCSTTRPGLRIENPCSVLTCLMSSNFEYMLCTSRYLSELRHSAWFRGTYKVVYLPSTSSLLPIFTTCVLFVVAMACTSLYCFCKEKGNIDGLSFKLNISNLG